MKKKTLEKILLTGVLTVVVPIISNAQSTITLMGDYLKNNLGYVVHGTAVRDTVSLDLFNPGDGTTARIIPEIYLSKADTSDANQHMLKPLSITFTSPDSANKYRAIINGLGGNDYTYDQSSTPEQNAQKLDMILKGLTDVSNNIQITQKDYALLSNYPNPFNPVTKIPFTLKKAGHITLKIYTVLGQEVKSLVDGIYTPGRYVVGFDGSMFSSGQYFYRLESSEGVITRKMTLVK